MRSRLLIVMLPPPCDRISGTIALRGLSSGYVQRAARVLPRQGARSPWRVQQNYLRDLLAFHFSPLEDGAMQFSRRGAGRFVQQ